jgi:hypothetical protein
MADELLLEIDSLAGPSGGGVFHGLMSRLQWPPGFAGIVLDSSSTSIGIAGGAVSETGQWACSKR